MRFSSGFLASLLILSSLSFSLAEQSYDMSSPSESPSVSPSMTPSLQPSSSPSMTPSVMPSQAPSMTPSVMPSSSPSVAPSRVPTTSPSVAPSRVPTTSPSVMPSSSPSVAPSRVPTSSPTSAPTGTLQVSARVIVTTVAVPVKTTFVGLPTVPDAVAFPVQFRNFRNTVRGGIAVSSGVEREDVEITRLATTAAVATPAGGRRRLNTGTTEVDFTIKVATECTVTATETCGAESPTRLAVIEAAFTSTVTKVAVASTRTAEQAAAPTVDGEVALPTMAQAMADEAVIVRVEAAAVVEARILAGTITPEEVAEEEAAATEIEAVGTAAATVVPAAIIEDEINATFEEAFANAEETETLVPTDKTNSPTAAPDEMDAPSLVFVPIVFGVILALFVGYKVSKRYDHHSVGAEINEVRLQFEEDYVSPAAPTPTSGLDGGQVPVDGMVAIANEAYSKEELYSNEMVTRKDQDQGHAL